MRTRLFSLLVAGIVGVLVGPPLQAATVVGCLDDPLSGLIGQHQFAQAEQLIRQRLSQDVVRKDANWHLCLQHFLGGMLARQERLDEALVILRRVQAEEAARLPEDDDLRLQTSTLLASVLEGKGDLASAIRINTELLPIFERRYRPYSHEVARLVRSLATSFAWAGNHKEVLSLTRRELDILQKLAQHREQTKRPVDEYLRLSLAQAKIRLAEALLRFDGTTVEAGRLIQEGVPEIEAQLGKHHPDTLDARLIHATHWMRVGELQRALALNQEVAREAREHWGPDHPVTRKASSDLAFVLSKSGNAAEASVMARDNLDQLIGKFGRNHPNTLFAYSSLVRELVRTQRWDEALAVGEEGLNASLTLRKGLGFDSRLQNAWLSNRRDLLQAYLGVLMIKKRFQDVLLAAEFFRNRFLSDRLALNGDELSLDEAGRKEYRTLNLRLAQLDQDIALRRNLRLNTDSIAAKRLAMLDRLQKLAAVPSPATALEERVPKADRAPSWVGMLRTLSLEKTAYVSLFRINDRMYAMTYTEDEQLLAVSLGRVDVLRERVHALRQLVGIPPTSAEGKPHRVWRNAQGRYRLAAQGQEGEQEVTEPDTLIQELSESLIAPLDRTLQGRSQVMFSSDGILAHLPFSLLHYNGEPLVSRYAVSFTPSLEALSRIRLLARAKAGKATRPILAIGGAEYQRVQMLSRNLLIQYEKLDPQPMDAKMIRDEIAKDPKQLVRAMIRTAIGFSNLPSSQKEVVRIVQDFGGTQLGSEYFTGEMAAEATWNQLARDGELERYKVIHFSTHGYLSDDDPALSSIVLSQVNRESGTDGFLTAAELAGVDINADLVVISACNSGVTGLNEGEGMKGLAYALTEAGARHSLLTLWPILDQRSTEFMIRFYQAYRAGASPAQALASTQRWALSEHWELKDWAPYVVYGN